MTESKTRMTAYWEDAFQINDADLEHLYNLLIEDETPLTTEEMGRALVERRIKLEGERLQHEKARGARLYLPGESYHVGEELVFPALQYATGSVQAVRAGRNPEYGEFDVLQIELGGGQAREFAARLTDHQLNALPEPGENGGLTEQSPDDVMAHSGQAIIAKLNARLQKAGDLVRIAGRWFPRALLAEIHAGHLNLAEAVLDVNDGGPLPTRELQTHLELPQKVNPKLMTFSLDYALQEDERFDEVGPAGEILWHLRRLEPAEVLFPPRRLSCEPVSYERRALTPELLKLEQELDDEFSEVVETLPDAANGEEVTLALTFPHRREGTLPLSPRLARLFPTAYEAPRIRFILVDGKTGEKFPGWVVRQHRFVYGLAEWYKKHDVVAGAYVMVRPGALAGEVEVHTRHRRPISEWVRTVTASEHRGLIFSMKRQPIRVEYDEHMIVIVDNPVAVDQAWLRSQERNAPLAAAVANVFRELARLNPQSAVHARALYSAVNVIRRSPPGPIFAELAGRPHFVHVGDLYWKFDESRWSP